MKKNLDKITLTIMQNQNSKKKETIVRLFQTAKKKIYILLKDQKKRKKMKAK